MSQYLRVAQSRYEKTKAHSCQALGNKVLWRYVVVLAVSETAVSLQQIASDSEKFAQNILKRGNTAALAKAKSEFDEKETRVILSL